MQRYTSAVKRAYRGGNGLERLHAEAAAHRAWLESLEIEPAVRSELVEIAAAVETAFADLIALEEAGR